MTVEDIKQAGRVEIICSSCGYRKIVTVNPDDESMKNYLHFQEEKDCPNCGSSHTLRIHKIK